MCDKTTDNKQIKSVVVDLSLVYIRLFGAIFIVHMWLETVVVISFHCIEKFEYV